MGRPSTGIIARAQSTQAKLLEALEIELPKDIPEAKVEVGTRKKIASPLNQPQKRLIGDFVQFFAGTIRYIGKVLVGVAWHSQRTAARRFFRSQKDDGIIL